MELLYQRLGPHVTFGDLADLGAENMSQCDSYEDESQNIERLGETIYTCKNTTPNRGQDGQRPSSTSNR